MSGAPALFDRRLVGRRRRRALANPVEGADLLQRRAAEDLQDRLAAVLRRFPAALDLASPGPHAAEALRMSGQVDDVQRFAPDEERPEAPEAAPEDLGLPPASLDLVVSLLALQTVNDLPGVFVQVRRALRPDGLFVACLLGGASLTELRQAFAEAESEMEGGVSPRVAPFADVRDLGGLLQRAGFALPVTDTDSVTIRYASPLGLLRDLRANGATNPLTERRRTPLRRGTLLRALEIYAERFSDPDGKVRATLELVWLSGWAPHESQQQPLKPGSAKARLADALRVPERPAGEKPER